MTSSGKPTEPANPTDEPPSAAELANRYVALWQDELSAMAADPSAANELGQWFPFIRQHATSPETWLTALYAAASAVGNLSGTVDGDDGPRPENPPTGAAATGVASGARSSDLVELAERITALERQVDKLVKRTKP